MYRDNLSHLIRSRANAIFRLEKFISQIITLDLIATIIIQTVNIAII